MTLTGPVETRENLVRARRGTGTLELRAGNADTGATLFGHFARFNAWYEVKSLREGFFLERVAPGAFSQAFTEQRSQIRVMFEHGQDPTVGQKPLGTIVDLREDKQGAYYEVRLFDTPYVNDLIPAMRSDQLGASFRFSIPEEGDVWDRSPRRSAHNPDGLPERTITRVDPLYEFGPVVWGASPTATSDVRSGTDRYAERLLTDPEVLAQFIKRVGENRSAQIIISLVPEYRSEQPSGVPPVEPVPTEEPADSGPDDTPPPQDPEPSAADGAESADDSTESNATKAIPEAPVVDPTKGNHTQIAAALKAFRQTNQREK